MDELPAEIIDLIVSNVRAASYPVTGLAVLSRTWQSCVERQIFKSLALKSTELEQFQTYLQGTRRQYLSRIGLSVILPEYPESDRTVFESEAERDQNDAAFSQAIHSLFNILNSWPNDTSLELNIEDTLSPTDFSRQNDDPILSWEKVLRDNGNFYMRYRYSYIRLLRTHKLPIVNCVHKLEVNLVSWLYRKLAPRCPMDIAAKLPNLRTLRARMADTELTFLTLRRKNREDLAEALFAGELSTTMRHLDLDLAHRRTDNQHFNVPLLTESEESVDPVSQAISAATWRMTNLESLHVRGVIDHSLFQPAAQLPLSPDTTSPQGPFWQNLTTLHTIFDLESPSGRWYFRPAEPIEPDERAANHVQRAGQMPPKPPGYGDSAWEVIHASSQYSFMREFSHAGNWLVRKFRLVPDDRVLQPLVHSFAQACAQIPRLKTAALATVLSDSVVVSEPGYRKNVSSNWGVYFAAQGCRSDWWVDLQGYDDANANTVVAIPDEDLRNARLTFNTRGWMPDEGSMGLLRRIPTGRVALEERHIDLWETVEAPRHRANPREDSKEKAARFHKFFLDTVVDPGHFWKIPGK